MKSILDEKLRENFFIRLYFDDKEGFYHAGIRRAFLDFCRTLKILNANRENVKQDAKVYLFERLCELNKNKLADQREFDDFHKTSCDQLILIWSQLKIGQAQKWINMTLKYWLLFGDERITGIETNAQYFHIPVDSYVQKEMIKEKSPKAWSTINDYDVYMKYQHEHRLKQTGNYPIIDEFIFFNTFRPK